MKTDIFYIHPSTSLKKIGYCIFPAGVISILNYLKENGFSVSGLNYPLEKCLNKNFNLKNFLFEKKFEIIAIDLHWHQHSYGAVEIAKFLKKLFPDTPIVLGGYTATFFAKEILKEIKEIDFVIKGDAHLPLLKLIQNIKENKNYFEEIPNLVYRKGIEIFETPQEFILKDLNKLNFVDISFLNNSKYYYYTHLHYYGEKIPFFILTIASGCIHNCICCGGSKYSSLNILKRNFLIRNPEKILEDMEYLSKIGIKKIWFSHDLQSLGRENFSELFSKIRKKNLKFGGVMDIWENIDSDFLKEFSATFEKENSALTISPISGNEKVRKKFGKLYGNREFMETILKLKKENIPVEVYFSYYLPFENYKFFKETLEILNNLKNIFSNKKIFLECKPAVIDPGSLLFENPEKYDVEILKKNFRNFYNSSKKRGFFYKISKDMIGYSLKNSQIHPLFLYIFWSFLKFNILFRKILEFLTKIFKIGMISK
jgi:radical SAM superfamily enzyme YgiQ (UPF0313 family)